MERARALGVLEKLAQSYRTKLGLARYYADPKRGGWDKKFDILNDKQRKKAAKYEEIVAALEFALEHMEDT